MTSLSIHMGKDNKIFCTAPFTTLRIESYSASIPGKYDQYGVIFKPGCVYDPQGPISSLDEYLQGQEMSWHRNNLLQGLQPHPGCHRCWKSEQIGLDSTRKQLLKKPYASDQMGIKLLDVFFGNVCNMACFMCDPEWSSKHAEESYQLGFIKQRIDVKDNTDTVLETIDLLPDLEQVSFIGGEFFLFKNNVKICNKIIEKNLEARIVTNASVLTDELWKKLTEIKAIEMQISIDAIEETYALMRYPYTWDTLIGNYQKLKQLSNIKLNFHVVTQVLNIQNLHATLDWANRERTPISLHNLSPGCWSWDILTVSEKIELKQYLQDCNQRFRLISKQTQWIQDLIDGLDKVKFSPQWRQQFVDRFSKLMKHRKVDIPQIQKHLGIFRSLFDEVLTAMDAH